jgi:hypothetical protein
MTKVQHRSRDFSNTGINYPEEGEMFLECIKERRQTNKEETCVVKVEEKMKM